MPPRSIITKLVSSAKQQYLDGYNSVRVSNETIPLPLWALRFWSTLHLKVEPRRSASSAAVNWLQASSIKPTEVHKMLDAPILISETLASTVSLQLLVDAPVVRPASTSTANPFSKAVEVVMDEVEEGGPFELGDWA
ncbi:hypothetical protein DXG01_002678 [Tephrocybe rancida]|nr:hypothetical protein DXG01_002678 [Tephrocybe rancida]